VQCTADPEAQVGLSDSAAMHLYRLAQEGIANAARHARARDIDVVLARRERRGLLTIADDGEGIALAPEQQGMGLRIMRYRASMIDGTLDIFTAPGRGTRISCDFPIGAAADATTVE
jgi:two-component system sensor histidine kinase UhpB